MEHSLQVFRAQGLLTTLQKFEQVIDCVVGGFAGTAVVSGAVRLRYLK